MQWWGVDLTQEERRKKGVSEPVTTNITQMMKMLGRIGQKLPGRQSLSKPLRVYHLHVVVKRDEGLKRWAG